MSFTLLHKGEMRMYSKLKKGLLCLVLLITTTASATGTKEVFKNHLNNYFVETGTYEGQAVKWALESGFKHIRTVELSEYYYHHCRKIFQNNENVEIYFGDSANLLWDMISDIDEPITFWLDGHWSGGKTAKGETFTPLIRELEQIALHPINTHTILIDDVRCFGTDVFDYTELEQVLNILHSINPNYEISFTDGAFEQDILVAEVKR